MGSIRDFVVLFEMKYIKVLNWVIVYDFIKFVKFGIIILNLIVVFGGFWIVFVSVEKLLIGMVFLMIMVIVMFGIVFVMVFGIVYNNFFDWYMDVKMVCICSRVLVIGKILLVMILMYGFVLGIVGFVMLYFFNLLIVFFGLVVFIFYVIIYIVWVK